MRRPHSGGSPGRRTSDLRAGGVGAGALGGDRPLRQACLRHGRGAGSAGRPRAARSAGASVAVGYRSRSEDAEETAARSAVGGQAVTLVGSADPEVATRAVEQQSPHSRTRHRHRQSRRLVGDERRSPDGARAVGRHAQRQPRRGVLRLPGAIPPVGGRPHGAGVVHRRPGGERSTPHAATKGAIQSLTKSLALSCAADHGELRRARVVDTEMCERPFGREAEAGSGRSRRTYPWVAWRARGYRGSHRVSVLRPGAHITVRSSMSTGSVLCG